MTLCGWEVCFWCLFSSLSLQPFFSMTVWLARFPGDVKQSAAFHVTVDGEHPSPITFRVVGGMFAKRYPCLCGWKESPEKRKARPPSIQSTSSRRGIEGLFQINLAQCFVQSVPCRACVLFSLVGHQSEMADQVPGWLRYNKINSKLSNHRSTCTHSEKSGGGNRRHYSRVWVWEKWGLFQVSAIFSSLLRVFLFLFLFFLRPLRLLCNSQGPLYSVPCYVCLLLWVDVGISRSSSVTRMNLNRRSSPSEVITINQHRWDCLLFSLLSVDSCHDSIFLLRGTIVMFV